LQLKFVRKYPIITIQPADVLATRQLQCFPSRAAATTIAGKAINKYTTIGRGGYYLGRIIGRTIVDDNAFPIGKRLGLKRRQSHRQGTRAVENGSEDRNLCSQR
jgi:hypothetical protein